MIKISPRRGGRRRKGDLLLKIPEFRHFKYIHRYWKGVERERERYRDREKARIGFANFSGIWVEATSAGNYCVTQNEKITTRTDQELHQNLIQTNT